MHVMPDWTASPASLARIGLQVDAKISLLQTSQHIPNRFFAAIPQKHSNVPQPARAPGAVAVLLAAEPLQPISPDTLEEHVAALLAHLHCKNFVQTITRVEQRNLTSALASLGPCWQPYLSHDVQHMLLSPELHPVAVLTCKASAHLALIRSIERNALFRAELCGRITLTVPEAPPHNTQP